MSNIQIDASNMSYLVNNAFQNCLFKDTEVNTTNITVEGLNKVFFLHPKRLEEQRELVTALVAELPPDFKKGYSFLALCNTKSGHPWTDSQADCQKLMVMAIGLKLMSYTHTKEFWRHLPDGVPYVKILN